MNSVNYQIRVKITEIVTAEISSEVFEILQIMLER